MTDRRRPGPGELNVDRLMARVEASNQALRERMEQLVDGVDARLGRIEHDVANGTLERASLLRELGEVRRDLGENRAATNLLRDDLDAHKQAELRAADQLRTELVAYKTSERISLVATTLGMVGSFKTAAKWQKGIAAVSGAGLLIWVIKEAPGAIRFLNSVGQGIAAFWHGMGK